MAYKINYARKSNLLTDVTHHYEGMRFIVVYEIL